ncbi:GTPase HflX [Salisediminibacterium beveridgei]|uniref:GTPase HflX n=1 Tax=Salisediminibacterium beveridgei TaxID=632773 RepID=A0A1D7QVS4_9BACI|nr:GTPase HflX [Salisediminibacterium beveridgei]AOM83105.1 GTP-binding protein HflX [Salisediminibacterium beveridgei]
MKEKIAKQRIILVGVEDKQGDRQSFRHRMDELASLTETAGGVVISRMEQALDHPVSATYIGRGKLEELKKMIAELEADLTIFNGELTPSQLRNIGNELDSLVLDRTQLILDIFAQRAQSKEGKLQVELAQLSYLLPRLRGQGHIMSRLGGGIGTRGPGETQLEVDQRHIRQRMDDIKRQLEQVVAHRTRYRDRRKRNQAFQVALVGYTNAGKSTLLNQVTNADVFAEDQLFATLDPTTKQISLPKGMHVLLSDTVGFIQQLPTTLIAAFRSTLEEVTAADFIVHVVDASHEDASNHEASVADLLKDLDAHQIPQLTVYNKQDMIQGDFFALSTPSILLSAHQKNDVERFLEKLERSIEDGFIPYQIAVPAYEGKFLHRLKQETIVHEEHFRESDEHYVIRGYAQPGSSIYNVMIDEKSIAKEVNDGSEGFNSN